LILLLRYRFFPSLISRETSCASIRRYSSSWCELGAGSSKDRHETKLTLGEIIFPFFEAMPKLAKVKQA